jgi:glycosyltransferase involved in cell wall biosynthesis
MFGWEFPPNISGGLGTACKGLVKGLSSVGGVDVTFVVPRVFGNEEKGSASMVGAGDIPVTRGRLDKSEFSSITDYLQVQSGLVPYTDPESWSKQLSFTVEGIESSVRTNAEGKINFAGNYGPDLFSEIAGYALVAGVLARTNDFDIIHAHDWLTYPAGIAARRISGKPLVVHVHATDFDRSGGSVNPSVFNIEKQGMKEADRVITVSNLTRKIVIEKYGISPAKVQTVYNAVEPVQPLSGAAHRVFNEKIVTFLGRITRQKGPEYFIDTAEKVLQRIRDVRFVMAGSGDMLNRMISRVARLKISDRFHFAGFLKGADVHRMYSMSDVYVMPSVSEPFGISPLEAMQAGVPVIISRQSGVSEILHNAVIVDFWDLEAMADAICGMLAYPAVSGYLSRNGQKECNHFSWKDSALDVRNIYSGLAG